MATTNKAFRKGYATPDTFTTAYFGATADHPSGRLERTHVILETDDGKHLRVYFDREESRHLRELLNRMFESEGTDHA